MQTLQRLLSEGSNSLHDLSREFDKLASDKRELLRDIEKLKLEKSKLEIKIDLLDKQYKQNIIKAKGKA